MNTDRSPEEPNAGAEGASTLTEALAEFAGMGFETEFRARPGGELVCGHCGQLFSPDAGSVAGERRLEGASDPDDMQLVLALSCPHCSSKGTVVVAYGPTGDEESQDLLARVAR